MTPTTATIFFDQPITGPRQLIELLASSFSFEPKNALIEIWLDSNSQCFKFETHECTEFDSAEIPLEPILEIGAESTEFSLILVLTFAHDCDAKHDIPRSAIELLEKLQTQIEMSNIKLLDSLFCTPQRWWSAMCSSESCCPTTGRMIEVNQAVEPSQHSVRALWEQVSSIIERSDSQIAAEEFEVFSQAVEKMCDNITFRDCILSHSATRPETRAKWETYFKKLAALPQFNKPMISTVLAALAYLTNDLSEAGLHLKISFQMDPQYSLARLLRQGLIANAPASLLQSAFSVYTPDQLIDKSEK